MRFLVPLLALALGSSALADKFPDCVASQGDFVSSDSGVILFTGRDLTGSDNIGPIGSLLAEVRVRLAAQGTQLVMLVPPLRGAAFTSVQTGVTPEQTANAAAIYSHYLSSIRAAGIPVVDLSDLSSFKSELNGFFLKGDHHWSPEGAQYAARLTAAMLELPAADPVQFTTNKLPLTKVQGTYLDLLEKRCGYKTTSDQWESVQPYTTKEVGGGLLGDETTDVMVVGDSFVDGPWNFTGFLQQALKRNVLNAGVGGGGAFSPMIRYLRAPLHPAPKVIIWEIWKGNLDAELDGSIRPQLQLQANTRLLLGAFGTCKADASPQSVADTKGGFTLPLAGNERVLRLEFASPSTGEFTLTLNNAEKSIPMLVSRQYKTDADKVFQFELNDTDLSGLKSLTVSGDTLNGSAQLSRCP